MPPSLRITVDAVEGFDLVGFFVASLALLVRALVVGHRLGRDRSDCAGSRTGAQRRKELTTPQAQLALRFHSASSRTCAARSVGQRECFLFDLDKAMPHSTDMAIEIGRIGDC